MNSYNNPSYQPPPPYPGIIDFTNNQTITQPSFVQPTRIIYVQPTEVVDPSRFGKFSRCFVFCFFVFFFLSLTFYSIYSYEQFYQRNLKQI